MSTVVLAKNEYKRTKWWQVESNTKKYIVVVVENDDDDDEYFIYLTIIRYSSIYCSFHFPIILL